MCRPKVSFRSQSRIRLGLSCRIHIRLILSWSFGLVLRKDILTLPANTTNDVFHRLFSYSQLFFWIPDTFHNCTKTHFLEEFHWDDIAPWNWGLLVPTWYNWVEEGCACSYQPILKKHRVFAFPCNGEQLVGLNEGLTHQWVDSLTGWSHLQKICNQLTRGLLQLYTF